MNDLPSAAEAVLQAARKAHDPSDAEVARSLARLSASLPFAPEPSVGAAELMLPRTEATLPASQGLFVAKLAKLSLVVAAVGGVLGGAWLLLPLASRAPVVQHVTAAAPLSRPAVVDAAAAGSPVTKTAAEEREATVATPTPPTQPSVDPQAVSKQATTERSTSRVAPARARLSRTTSERALPTADSVRLAPTVAAITSDRANQLEAAPQAEPSAAPVAARAQEPTPRVDAPTAEPPSRPTAMAPSELELIDGAAQRLRTGDEEGALRLLDEHLALYPAGVLQTERAGLRVLALCAAGRVAQGSAERAAFLRVASGTPLTTRVRRACSDGQTR